MKSLEKLIQLSKITGKNNKKKFLSDNMNDKEFMSFLYFLLNPMIVTGISKKKINKDVDDCDGYTLLYDTPKELFDYLIENNTGRDIDIRATQSAIAYMTNGDSNLTEIFNGVITKSLKLGVTGNTVNEIVPKFIPHFSPMLAKSFEEITDHKKELKNGYTITLKLNGVRAVVRKENGNVEIRSREGREFVGVTDMKNQYMKSSLPDGVYDGELVAIRKGNESTDDMFRRTISLVSSHDETDELEHIVFEYLTLDEWDNTESKLNYSDRFNRLFGIFDHKINSNKIETVRVINISNSFDDNSLNNIYSTLKSITKDGYEGIMINPHDKPYIFKRGKSLFKAKEFDSADLLVLDIYEGDNRLKGSMGGLTLSWRNGHKFNLGTGFTDKERQDFWNNPELIVGKIVEINYQAESENLSGGEAVQFGSFQCIRYDKGIDDIRYSDKD